MLAGRMMFGRENVTETLAEVILKDPDWSALPPRVPARIRDLIARCLVRDPRQRLRDIGDARIAIDEALHEPMADAARTAPPVPAPTRSRRRELVLGAIALAGVLTAAGVFVRSALAPASALPRVEFEVFPPAGLRPAYTGGTLRWIEMSADGRHLAFAGITGPGIFVRSLDTATVRPVVPAELLAGAPATFFWSPDGASLAFFAGGKLQVVPAAGGSSRAICALPPGHAYFGTWGAEGVILFAAVQGNASTLWRVPAGGGEPATVRRPETSEPQLVTLPVFLPDGRHFTALRVTGPQQPAEAFIGALDSPDREALFSDVDSQVRYVAPGYLVFARGGALVAQRFELASRRLSGEVFPVGPQIADASFGASTTGSLAYRPGSPPQNSTLAWFDRTGKRLRTEALDGSIQAPTLSRDGKQVVVERTDASGTDLWNIDLTRRTSTRLTDDPAPDIRPVLSPDGTQVVFTRNGKIIRKFSSGTGNEEHLADGETTDWSPDGKFISFIGDGTLWALPLAGDRTPIALVQTKGNDRRGRFSPDGKWIAYESNFSGRFEVYVQRFPPTAERVQVSVEGGGSAYWRMDSKELFFLSPDQRVMSVEITPGEKFQASAPRRLFEVPGVITNGRFVVAPDGKEFLMPVQRAEPSSITVVLNWPAGLAK